MKRNNYTSSNFLRIEDANSKNSILRISPTTSFDVDVYSEITFKQKLSNDKVLIRINGEFLSNSDYGNLISDFDIIRIFTQVQNKDWVDIKITNSYYDTSFPGETVIEGIIVNGDYTSIQINDEVIWGFFLQETPDNFQKLEIEITNIQQDSAVVRWKDFSKFDQNLFYQIKYKEQGIDNWIYSILGNWIFGFSVDIEATNLPNPNRTFNAKNVLWVETESPEINHGQKATAWVEIKNGNFGEIFFQQIGGGYRQIPKVNFYYDDPSNSFISNPRYRKPFYSVNEIIIEKNSHGFIDGDLINFRGQVIRGKYKVYNSSLNNFRISSPSFDILPDDNLLRQEEGFIKAANLEVSKPGVLKPILSKDKYYIQNLISNRDYEVAIIPYFSNDLKNYGEYTYETEFRTK